ncbi:hypothetical protein D9M68_920120 [compost metagenome]
MRAHFHDEERGSQHGREAEGPAELAGRSRLAVGGGNRLGTGFGRDLTDVITGLLDRRFKHGARDQTTRCTNGGLFGGEIDTGTDDARYGGQSPLDASDARRAGHALNFEFEAFEAGFVAGRVDGGDDGARLH